MNEENNNATVGGENQPNGADKDERETVSFEDLLNSNKEYRQEFDRRMNKTVETTTNNINKSWETKLNNEKTEAERLAQMNETEKLQYQLQKKQKDYEDMQRKLNARDLKDEAIRIATTPDTAFEPEFLNLFEFENMTAEQLQEKAKALKTIQDRIVEKTINEWSKEKSPYNPNQDGQSNNDAQLAQIFGNTTN